MRMPRKDLPHQPEPKHSATWTRRPGHPLPASRPQRALPARDPETPPPGESLPPAADARPRGHVIGRALGTPPASVPDRRPLKYVQAPAPITAIHLGALALVFGPGGISIHRRTRSALSLTLPMFGIRRYTQAVESGPGGAG